MKEFASPEIQAGNSHDTSSRVRPRIACPAATGAPARSAGALAIALMSIAALGAGTGCAPDEPNQSFESAVDVVSEPLPMALRSIATPDSHSRWIELRPDRQFHPLRLFDEHRDAFGLGDEAAMQLIDVQAEGDWEGFRYQQTYRGIEIEGAQMVVHSKHEQANLVAGVNVRGLVLATPRIPGARALELALAAVPATRYAWQDIPADADPDEIEQLHRRPEPRLVITSLSDRSGDSPQDYVLAYRVDVKAFEPELRHVAVYVDAQRGTVLKQTSLIHHGCRTGSVATLYDGTRSFTTKDAWEPFWSHYRLTDECRGDEIHTRCNANTSCNYKDSDNSWDGAAATSHWAAQRAWQYFQSTHYRNGVNGGGQRLYVFPNIDFGQANAGWSSDGSILVGNGGPSWGNMATLDVIGHEFTHGVVQHTSGLNGAEASALNESFADIFGSMIERVESGLSADTWRIGEDASLVRSLQDPESLGAPATYHGWGWDWSNEPHNNAGVQNHWFFLLSQGGTRGGVAVQGIGPDRAARIAYRNMTTLWPSATYADARNGAINAARTLYGLCTSEEASTTNAWAAVGIGAPHTPCLNLSPIFGDSYVCTDLPYRSYSFSVQTSAPPWGITWSVPPDWNYSLSGDNKSLWVDYATTSGSVQVTASANGFTQTSSTGVDAQQCNSNCMYSTERIRCDPVLTKSSE